MLLKISFLSIGIVYAPSYLLSGTSCNANLCELIRSGDKFDGKLIRVSGLLQDSDPNTINPYFDELVSHDCNDVNGKPVKILIVSPDQHFLANAPAGYKPDLRSIHRAEIVAEQAAARHHSLRATVEGVYYVSKTASSTSARHRQYPAVLVLQSIRDVKEQ